MYTFYFFQECLKKSFQDDEYSPTHPGCTRRYNKKLREDLYRTIYDELYNTEATGYPYQMIDISTGTQWSMSLDTREYNNEITELKMPINRRYLSEGYDLIKEPLEDMPLYIQDCNTFKRAVAKWRLKIGR